MTSIHFKLSFNGKTYRFAPTVQGDQLFQAVKDQVASFVKEDDYKLCWDNGQSTMLLDTDDDFSNMIEYAKEKAKSSTKPSCIHLVVGAASSENSAVAAAAAESLVPAAAKAPEVAESVNETASESVATDASDSSDEESSDDNETAPPVVWRFSDSENSGKAAFTACKVRSLLDMADEKRRAEMDQLTALAEEMKTNAEKQLTVESFAIRPSMRMTGGDFSLDFTFKSLPDYSMWKACIESALSMLDIDESALRPNKYPARLGMGGDRWGIHIELEARGLKRVLEVLKPLASRTHFSSIRVDEKEQKYMRLLPEFLDGATVKSLTFNCGLSLGLKKTKKSKPTDFSISLKLLQKVKATELIYYREQATKEMFDFLGEAADLVEQMTVASLGYGKKKEEPLPLSITQNILSKKCNYLNISDSTTKVTLAEAEELVKFFEEKEMKVSLAIPTKEKMMDINVGAYRVKFANLRSHGGSQLLIEHEDMERKMEEIEQERYEQ